MSKKTVYVVRLWTMAGRQIGRIRNVAGRKLEVTVTSLRAAIALTYGLTCEWEVAKWVGSFEFCGVVGNEIETRPIDPTDKAFHKTFKHNVRAFRQSLRPTFQDIARQAIWASVIV